MRKHQSTIKRWIAGLLIITANSALAAGQLTSSSEATTVLELYTSEGCSSCPPADQYVTQLVNHPQLWNEVIPLVFHVDYWDYIGWKDQFASSEYSQRQRKHRSLGNVRSVYTPGFVVDGKEWRGWFSRNNLLPTNNKKPGVLKLNISEPGFSAQFDAEGSVDWSELKLNIALLGAGFQSKVKAGENRGKILQHDFVVLSLKSYSPSNGEWQGQLPALTAKSQGAERLAWVAWLSGRNNKPIQAVGNWRDLVLK